MRQAKAADVFEPVLESRIGAVFVKDDIQVALHGRVHAVADHAAADALLDLLGGQIEHLPVVFFAPVEKAGAGHGDTALQLRLQAFDKIGHVGMQHQAQAQPIDLPVVKLVEMLPAKALGVGGLAHVGFHQGWAQVIVQQLRVEGLLQAAERAAIRMAERVVDRYRVDLFLHESLLLLCSAAGSGWWTTRRALTLTAITLIAV